MDKPVSTDDDSKMKVTRAYPVLTQSGSHTKYYISQQLAEAAIAQAKAKEYAKDMRDWKPRLPDVVVSGSEAQKLLDALPCDLVVLHLHPVEYRTERSCPTAGACVLEKDDSIVIESEKLLKLDVPDFRFSTARASLNWNTAKAWAAPKPSLEEWWQYREYWHGVFMRVGGIEILHDLL